MYGEGKFFFIRSQLNELVLDIKDAIANPGQEVVTWEYNGDDNQIWYEDQVFGVIRSKMDDNLVLHVDDCCLRVEEFHPDEYNQQWKVAGNKIRHREDSELVLDIADHNDEPGARVCSWEYNGGDNQLWTINYLPPKRFYVISQMHGKVFDVKRGDPEPGTKAVMYPMGDEEQDNQTWWEDKRGIIHSCLNDLVLSTADDVLRMEEYDPQVPGMQWVVSGHRIVNRTDPTLTLDIKEAKTKDNAKVIEDYYHGGDNQLFDFDYID